MSIHGCIARGLALAMLASGPAIADQSIPDQYPQSLLYSKPVEVIPHVWSAIGQTGPATYENAGHNNNLSFIVTGEGVIVINGGGAYLLAKALHDEIREITEEPVVLVVNENGQGHAMLGNTYWAEQGVEILAHEDAAAEFEEYGYDILDRMQQVSAERGEGTEVTLPTRTFSDKEDISLGRFEITALHLGPAHSPGDISVWLPEERLVIAGDMAFHERIPPIFEETDTAGWIETWTEAFEPLGALYVIPGHGHPTNMAQVRRYTHDYLVYLRGKVQEVLDAGEGLAEAYYVDQSPFAHLDTFRELATRNAGRVFEAMEFEQTPREPGAPLLPREPASRFVIFTNHKNLKFHLQAVHGRATSGGVDNEKSRFIRRRVSEVPKDIFLVAYEGDDDSVLDFAIAQAAATDAALHIVHVLEWSPYSFLTPQEIEERHARRKEELARAESAIIAPAIAKVKAAGVEATGTLQYGRVIDQICEVATKQKAKMLFVGKSGVSGLTGRVFGSVAIGLAQAAPVPTVIVP